MDTKLCGIYSIKNKTNEKTYIGQSVDILREWKYIHKNRLTNNKHHNQHLQRAWNKYGCDNFIHKIIEICKISELDDLEEYYILKMNAHQTLGGYNISFGKNPMKGRKHSKKTKLLLSEKSKGSKNSFFGKHHSHESIEKGVEKRKGYRHSEESKAKIRNNHYDFSGENGQNFGKKRDGTTSPFRGVYKVVCNGYLYWRAVIKLSGKTCFIGQYKDEVTAAKKYNEFVIKNSLSNPINIFKGINENE